MKTPICDFVKNYIDKKPIRLHVPGHKGDGVLGFEEFDVTEIDGADDLYCPSSIILKSEKNASKLFSCPTFYTTEGSSHAIRAMIYLATLYAKSNNKSTSIIATRNVHKSFLTVASLLNIDVTFIKDDKSNGYLSSNLTPELLEEYLKNAKVIPNALYVTSPDFLGKTQDVKSLKKVCEKYGVLLLVDNAHGAYLKFLKNSLFPIDLGADMCASSAHKTLPVLTGGAYLHLSNRAYDLLSDSVLTALTMFGSTSPSYLILQSLDYANHVLSTNFKKRLSYTVKKVDELKFKLKALNYNVLNNEPLKITLNAKSYGYTGNQIAKILYNNNIIPEFYDNDFIVFMFSVNTKENTFKALYNVLKDIKRRTPILSLPPQPITSTKKFTLKEIIYSNCEIIKVKDSENRVYAELNIHCPPAVPIIIPGEVITKDVIKTFKYYKIDKIKVVKE